MRAWLKRRYATESCETVSTICVTGLRPRLLKREGEFRDARVPDIILLDLNMPRKDGREVLAEIKQHPRWRLTPVVILTSSEAEKDILQSYELHANRCITKPVNLEHFTVIIRMIENFWLSIVTLPTCKAIT